MHQWNKKTVQKTTDSSIGGCRETFLYQSKLNYPGITQDKKAITKLDEADALQNF